MLKYNLKIKIKLKWSAQQIINDQNYSRLLGHNHIRKEYKYIRVLVFLYYIIVIH